MYDRLFTRRSCGMVTLCFACFVGFFLEESGEGLEGRMRGGGRGGAGAGGSYHPCRLQGHCSLVARSGVPTPSHIYSLPATSTPSQPHPWSIPTTSHISPYPHPHTMILPYPQPHPWYILPPATSMVHTYPQPHP